MKPNDVFKFRYSPKKEWGFDAREHCFEGYLVASPDLVLVDTYWGIGDTNGRVLDMARIEHEVAEGGSFEFYFNLDEVDSISNSEAVYFADDDLFHISEQHACSPRCRHTFVKRSAVRDAAKMMSVLQRQADTAIRESVRLSERYKRLQESIRHVMAGDLSIHVDDYE